MKLSSTTTSDYILYYFLKFFSQTGMHPIKIHIKLCNIFQVKSNITKLLFSQVICNLIILLSEVILLFVYPSYVKILFS